MKLNGEVANKKYIKGRFLGKGGFAKCYEFTNVETKKLYAAKIVPKASLTKNRAKQKLMSEIKIHRSLHYPNVVGFEHFFEDQENVYILLELCTNQTLNELIRRRKRLTELEVQCYIFQIISSLKYLHSYRVIHRDLKLGNCFLSEKMELKLGDFGLATKLEFEGERKRTICGTPNYIAPEILEGKHGHSYEVDIWSLGVIVYTLLIGKPPFETSDVKTTYKRIKMNAYSFPDHISISENARDLIQTILNREPSLRPSLDDIMNHPFLQGPFPKLLPAATLACPPSASYMRQYQSGASSSTVPKPMEATAPVAPSARKGTDPGRMMATDRIQSKPMASAASTKVKADLASPSLKEPEVWVKKWVDYSTKYGLGYLLSNGATGVFFNDSTKIILDPKGHHFDYLERRPSDKQDILTSHTLTDYPKELQKKVTLLQHFRSYLEGDAKPTDGQAEEEPPKRKTGDPVYVKKWMRTKYAIMFRLSNKIVQVNFLDHTEIILSSESRVVTYVNKKRERMTYPLTTAMESSNQEMSKRLKYTKDILTHLLHANAQAAAGIVPGGAAAAGGSSSIPTKKTPPASKDTAGGKKMSATGGFSDK